MIIIITIMNIILYTSLFILKSRQNSPFMFLYIMIISYVLIPSLLDIPNETVDYHQFAKPIFLAETTLIKSHIYITMVGTLMLFMELIFRRRSSNNIQKISINNKIGIFIYTPILTLFAVISGYFIIGSAIANANFESSRSGGLGVASLIIAYLSLFSIPIPALLNLQGRKILAIVALIPLSIPVIVFGGARQMLVIAVLSYVYSFIIKQKKAPEKIFLIIIILFPIAEYFLEGIKYIRNLPDLSSRIDAIANLEFLESAEFGGGIESSGRFSFYNIVSGIYIQDSFQLNYLLRTILFWLPSFLDVFSIKPADFEYNMFYAIMGGRQGTMHPTLFGSIFADSWLLFPFWISFLFLFMKFIESYLKNNNKYSGYIYFISIYICIMWARGSLYAPILVTFYIFIIINLHNIYIRMRNTTKKVTV